jgi:hypothetical protein
MHPTQGIVFSRLGSILPFEPPMMRIPLISFRHPSLVCSNQLQPCRRIITRLDSIHLYGTPFLSQHSARNNCPAVFGCSYATESRQRLAQFSSPSLENKFRVFKQSLSDAEKNELMKMVSGTVLPDRSDAKTEKLPDQDASRVAGDDGFIHPFHSNAPISRKQYKLLFISHAIPFFTFGFFDNALMIMFGEVIESSLHGVLALSTMVAAGLGNVVADGCGIGIGRWVESLSSRVEWMNARISIEQMQTKDYKVFTAMSHVIGITIGGLCGMSVLWFF